jgi:hypothetical protein
VTDAVSLKGEIIAERCTIETAELILGLKRRNIQAMSARGEIPGAAKFGSIWTFNLAKLRDFVEQMEERQWQNVQRRHRDVTGARIPSGAALGKMAATSGGHLKLMTQKLRRNGSKLVRTNS